MDNLFSLPVPTSLSSHQNPLEQYCKQLQSSNLNPLLLSQSLLQQQNSQQIQQQIMLQQQLQNQFIQNPQALLAATTSNPNGMLLHQQVLMQLQQLYQKQQQQQQQQQQQTQNPLINLHDPNTYFQVSQLASLIQKSQQQQFLMSQLQMNGSISQVDELSNMIILNQLGIQNNKLHDKNHLQLLLQQQQQQQQQLFIFQLAQQQAQLQENVKKYQETNEKEQINSFFSQERFKSFQGYQSSSELKQESLCLSEKVSSFESPNVSSSTLHGSSTSNRMQKSLSAGSQTNLNFLNQASPLFQASQESSNNFQRIVPSQWNLFLSQLQPQQNSLINQNIPSESISQLQGKANGICNNMNNVEGKHLKLKKKSNPKRNTIKNLGNQIISFMCNRKSIQIIQKIPQIEFEDQEFDEFKKFCEQYKNKMLKIADLRNIWISSTGQTDECSLKYHKIIRVLSRNYLNNEAIPKLLTSNKLKDRKIHLSIRRILVEKLKDPESFTTLNQYSKK